MLRHETADDDHYSKLHPSKLTLKNRKRCLYDIKKIGFQVGSGFMVGSPYQTTQNLADDLLFLKELQPQMIGIGPFIPHKDTPFKNNLAGTLNATITMIALTRLMLPKALLPATTALATIAEDGREKGILAGANVVMPNLSPVEVRKDYMLYDNKVSSGDEAAEFVTSLSKRLEKIGAVANLSRGDHVDFSIK